ncbi:MAG: GerMN domain-containing protein [Lachnospiraceae bacterium]|nr:GerMN domain-containing protein [Lachnospiraceae bacterium]
MNRKIIAVMILSAIMLTACSKSEVPEDAGYNTTVYDLDPSLKDLEPCGYRMKEAEDLSDSVGELLQRIIDGPDGNRIRSAIPSEITSVTYRVGTNTVAVDLGSAFAELPTMRRLLCEAAVVKTLCRLDGVYAVSFSADGVPACDSSGTPIGPMTADSFVGTDGERAELHLFFASADGQSLIEKEETVMRSIDTPMDLLVVENVISGPRSSDVYATVNPSTKINSVETSDGICYVNLSRDFLNKKTNVSDGVMIYSIVNSLYSLENVNRVRIIIDGDGSSSLGEYDLSGTFERNLDIMADEL